VGRKQRDGEGKRRWGEKGEVEEGEGKLRKEGEWGKGKERGNLTHSSFANLRALRFAEIGKAEVTKWVCGIYHKKGWHFAPSLELLDQSHQTFYRITLSPFLIPLPSFVQICPVFEEIYPKMSSRLITVLA